MEDSGPSGPLAATRRYYDAFAARYDAARGGRVPGGYHDLVDELELGFLARYARGRDVLEAGCGTGLLLERIAETARSARGVDLSPGMLAHARRRGLDCVEGSVTELPFEAASFDVVCSFKVLAHVPQIGRAIAEMTRVLRPGGTLVAEFYNRHSLRALVKRLGPARAVAAGRTEAQVYTRYDSPAEVAALLPPRWRVVASRGVRIVLPAAGALGLPLVGSALATLERRLCDSPLGRFGGFWIAAIRQER